MAPPIKNPRADANRRMVARDRRASVLAFLEKRVWKNLPKKEIGRVLSRAEENALLGYGPDGV